MAASSGERACKLFPRERQRYEERVELPDQRDSTRDADRVRLGASEIEPGGKDMARAIMSVPVKDRLAATCGRCSYSRNLVPHQIENPHFDQLTHGSNERELDRASGWVGAHAAPREAARKCRDVQLHR